MTTERDLRNQIAYLKQEAVMEGRAEGRAEGLAEGLAEGRVEGRAEGLAEGKAKATKENALNLRELGVDVAIISKATGLSVETIETLKLDDLD